MIRAKCIIVEIKGVLPRNEYAWGKTKETAMKNLNKKTKNYYYVSDEIDFKEVWNHKN